MSEFTRQRRGAGRGPAPETYTHQCRGKRRYTSKRLAGGILRVMVQKSGEVGRLHVYNCPVCSGWHVGSRRSD